MMCRRISAVVLFIAWSTSVHAQWQLDSVREISSSPGIRCLQVTAADQQTGAQAKLSLALCDNGKPKLRVIDRPNGGSSLADVMEEAGCVAGVNGGYFDPDDAPVGLLISDGRTISPLRRARLLSGVLTFVNERARIQRTAEFSAKSKISQAVQCGPFLVDHGTSIRGLEDTRRARRTFAAIGGNRFAIGVCSAVSLAQLSRILSSGNIGADFKIDRALNLDGGSSTGFWCKRSDGSVFSIPEQKTVRDFVGVSR